MVAPSNFQGALVKSPTPLRCLQRFESGSELWIKDDGESALPYGGNKVRKLELILPHAIEREARRVVTFGAAGSHHALATAVYAKQFGLERAAILVPQAWSPHAEDTLRAALGQGLEIHAVSHFARVMPAWLRIARRDDYWIAPGALGPRGSLGYLRALDEVLLQFEERGAAKPTQLIVAVGSGSTIAGLLVGIVARQVECQVVGVCSGHVIGLRAQILAQAWGLARYRGIPAVSLNQLSAKLSLVTSEIGPGYGRPTEETALAQAAAGEFRLDLDVTYTAKAFAVALRAAGHPSFRSPLFARSERILYWHTLSTAPMAPLLKSAPDEIPVRLNRLLVRVPERARDLRE
jgi:D-cysteine desulfhydrase